LPRSLPGAGALLRGLGHFYRGARAACLRWRRGGIPSSWATPACMPCSSTPADRSHPASPMRAMLPSAYITTSAPRLGFRGSITRPTGSLCTLRSRGRPRTTQHSVPAGGQPWPVRSCTCWVAKKVSALLVSLHGFLLHQALLGAIYNPHSITRYAVPFNSNWSRHDTMVGSSRNRTRMRASSTNRRKPS